MAVIGPDEKHRSSGDEKQSTSEHQHIDDGTVASDDYGFSPQEQKSIMRRVDRRLVVTVGVMYCVSLMDRINMSAANIAGMSVDLEMVGNNRYNVANLLFFIPYIIFQPPSTILVRKIGSRIHLSVITTLWGAVMIGMGFVDNYGQLYACRVLLGLLEAGFFPSCVYLLSTWYTRYEVGKRYSVFYLLGCVASAFSGILAYGLMEIQTVSDMAGWRWIFSIQGALTVLVGIAGYWLLVDFPDSPRKNWAFVGQRERDWVVSRIARDRGDAKVEPFNLRKFLRAGTDWKIWCYALIFFNSTTMTYSLAYTLPILLNYNMGFSVAASQCLVAPPYVFAGIVMFTTAWFGDKYHFRGPVIIINMVLALIGLPILGWHTSNAVRYFGVFLVTAGANSNIPAVMSYQANNLRGQWKRAFCSATLVGFGGIGGIAGSLVFREQDRATGYHPGMYACISCALLNIILVLILSVEFKRQNNKADREGKMLEAHDDQDAPHFRYTI
jgi:MFS family permease